MCRLFSSLSFFFFNDTATTEIYTLSLHDALPICDRLGEHRQRQRVLAGLADLPGGGQRGLEGLPFAGPLRSEEHTSELQSHSDLVCRLLLEKKKTRKWNTTCSTCRVATTLMRGSA